MTEISKVHESHEMYFNREGYWVCRRCTLCICHHRKDLENECSRAEHKEEVPTVRLTLELEGLFIADAEMVLGAFKSVEVPFKRISSIIEIEEN